MLGALRRASSRAAGDDRGVTLVEMSVVLLLLLVVTVPALNFLVSTQRQEKTVAEASRQQQDARVAIDQLTRWLREADYPDGHTYQNSQIFTDAASNDVTFYSDIDHDGVNERVRFYLDTTTHTLMRTVVEPDCSQGGACSYVSANATSVTSEVVPNVRNDDLTVCGQTGSLPVFSYFKRDSGTLTATPMPSPSPIYSDINDLVDIYYVKVTMFIDITPGKTPTCQNLTTAVGVRNWKG